MKSFLQLPINVKLLYFVSQRTTGIEATEATQISFVSSISIVSSVSIVSFVNAISFVSSVIIVSIVSFEVGPDGNRTNRQECQLFFAKRDEVYCEQ